jgi:hypothetical protein
MKKIVGIVLTMLLAVTAFAQSTLTIQPASLFFDNRLVGSVNPAGYRFSSFLNETGSTVNIFSIVLGGANPGDFTYDPSSTCGIGAVPNGGHCYIVITFSPTLGGVRSATLTFTDDAVTSPQSITMTGLGIPLVSTTPTAGLLFLKTLVGNTSSVKQVAITNNLATLVTFTSFTIVGIDPGDFAQTATTCGPNLAPHKHCTISVTFMPLAVGFRTASLNIVDDAGTQVVALSGKGK